jgi:riboflavin biosynthesis pyrimidine reductase
MEEDGCNPSGTYYDDKIFALSKAIISGRNTALCYYAHGQVDLTSYPEEKLVDNVVQDQYYDFVFDRHGKCFYQNNKFVYGGHSMQIVEVVAPNIDLRYLAYLKKMQIGYLIAHNVEEALIKIKKYYHLENIMLTGGALINGGFFKENLIDEISLIVAPYVEGNDQFKTFIGGVETFKAQKFVFSQANPLEDGGVELIFLKK